MARVLGAGRIAIGATLILVPGSTSVWAGPAARSPGVALTTRAAGVRDLLVGWRTVQAATLGAPLRQHLVDGAVADAVDLAAVLVAWPHLPRLARLGIAAAAAGAVGLGCYLASVLD
ncbi:MAG: hypothetical protein KY450_04465 [Actinobacteria bacterium]|nr:hypothetical protein [Actinomycetota bacterium]